MSCTSRKRDANVKSQVVVIVRVGAYTGSILPMKYLVRHPAFTSWNALSALSHHYVYLRSGTATHVVAHYADVVIFTSVQMRPLTSSRPDPYQSRTVFLLHRDRIYNHICRNRPYRTLSVRAPISRCKSWFQQHSHAKLRAR